MRPPPPPCTPFVGLDRRSSPTKRGVSFLGFVLAAKPSLRPGKLAGGVSQTQFGTARCWGIVFSLATRAAFQKVTFFLAGLYTKVRFSGQSRGCGFESNSSRAWPVAKIAPLEGMVGGDAERPNRANIAVARTQKGAKTGNSNVPMIPFLYLNRSTFVDIITKD